jgi:hypothetical protein
MAEVESVDPKKRGLPIMNARRFAALILMSSAALTLTALPSQEPSPHAPADHWETSSSVNPMTDVRSVVFKLKGKVDEGAIGSVNLAVICSGGKFKSAWLAPGMRLASSAYRTTPVTMRMGNRLKADDLPLTEDRTTAEVRDRRELQGIDEANSLVVEFKDAFGTGHYAYFTDTSFTPGLLSECGGLRKK